MPLITFRKIITIVRNEGTGFMQKSPYLCTQKK